MTDIIDKLGTVLKSRRDAKAGEKPGEKADESYVASLYAKGLDGILQKVGEEAVETLLAAKSATPGKRDEALVHEVADLWFHTLVLLVHLEQEPDWVLEELAGRFGLSGHAEKAQRDASQKARGRAGYTDGPTTPS